mgnify:FL=1
MWINALFRYRSSIRYELIFCRSSRLTNVITLTTRVLVLLAKWRAVDLHWWEGCWMFEYLVLWVVVARPIRRSYPCFLCLSIFLLFVYENDFFCQLSSHICNSWGTRTSSLWQVIDLPAQENWVQEFTMNIGSCVSTWKDIVASNASITPEYFQNLLPMQLVPTLAYVAA